MTTTTTSQKFATFGIYFEAHRVEYPGALQIVKNPTDWRKLKSSIIGNTRTCTASLIGKVTIDQLARAALLKIEDGVPCFSVLLGQRQQILSLGANDKRLATQTLAEFVRGQEGVEF